MEMLSTVIELPVWSVVAMVLAGVVVGMLFLTLAILLLGRGSVVREAKVMKTKIDDLVFAVAPALAAEPEIELEVEPEIKMEAVEPEPVVVPVVASVKQYKPVPPIRQHYWYYVSSDLYTERFPTLREALSAAGETVPADKALDWKKLSPDTRAKIKRVKVDDEQPLPELPEILVPELPEQVIASVEEVKDEPEREEKVKGEEDVRKEKESVVVIKKPIGDGAFVTITKKKSK